MNNIEQDYIERTFDTKYATIYMSLPKYYNKEKKCTEIRLTNNEFENICREMFDVGFRCNKNYKV